MPAVPTSKIERLVSAYSFGGEGKMTKIEEGAGLAVAGNSWTTPGGVYNGSGGLAGTVGDYFRFATMLCNKGLGSTGARILGTRTVEFMALNHLTGEEEIDTGGRTSFTEFGQRMPGIESSSFSNCRRSDCAPARRTRLPFASASPGNGSGMRAAAAESSSRFRWMLSR